MANHILKTMIATVLMGSAASGDEFAFGVGWDDLFDAHGRESMSVLIEYHSDPIYQSPWFNVSLLAVIQADNRGDVFAGLGVYNLSDIGRAGRYFLEASLAVGHFDQGGHRDIRDNGTRWRTSLGGGVHLNERRRVSLTLDHILDMDFKNYNPGSETLHVRYTVGF